MLGSLGAPAQAYKKVNTPRRAQALGPHFTLVELVNHRVIGQMRSSSSDREPELALRGALGSR